MFSGWFKTPVQTVQELDPTINEPKEEETKEEPKYIWVEGYKGVSQDLKGYNGFQYELNTEYSCDGEPIICENGFHLSLNLYDASTYKNIMEDRFFKVRALVRENDYLQYGKTVPEYFAGFTLRFVEIDKLVAKKIILLEEISTDQIYEQLKDRYKILKFLTKEEFLQIKENKISISKICENRLKNKGYSDTFSILLLKENPKMDDMIDIVYKAIALNDEGLSPDMRAYLLLKE